MRFTRYVAIPIVLVALALPGAYGCAARAAIETSPGVSEQQQVRDAAARAADGLRTGLAITRAAGRFIDTLPLSDAEKNAFDSAIVAATGTTAAPGPLVAALDALANVTSEASLRATVTTVFTLVDPLIVQLETHTNVGVAGFGISLRAATTFARNYVNQQGGVQ